jgi:hypothetical protein
MLSKFTAVGGIVEGRQHALQEGPQVAFSQGHYFGHVLKSFLTSLDSELGF